MKRNHFEFQKSLVAKTIKGRGHLSRFPVETFCLTETKQFVGRPFAFHYNSGIGKRTTEEVAGITIFRRKNFIYWYRIISQTNRCVFQKISGTEKLSDKRGVLHIFLLRSVETFRRKTFLSSKNFLVTKTIRDIREGGYYDFPSKVFGLTVP